MKSVSIKGQVPHNNGLHVVAVVVVVVVVECSCCRDSERYNGEAQKFTRAFIHSKTEENDVSYCWNNTRIRIPRNTPCGGAVVIGVPLFRAVSVRFV